MSEWVSLQQAVALLEMGLKVERPFFLLADSVNSGATERQQRQPTGEWATARRLPMHAGMSTDGEFRYRREHIEKIISDLTSPAAVASKTLATKSKAGRPMAINWDPIMFEIVRLANQPDGLSDKQSDVVKHLLERFEGPDDSFDSSVKAKISALYQYLSEVRN